jgi:branched-chain amino acid transport system permease protein
VGAEKLRRAGTGTAVVVVALVAGQVIGAVAGRGVPLGILVEAAVYGCMNALLAVGLVLVYRSNRVVNFAHTALGALAAQLALLLVVRERESWYVAIAFALVAAAATGWVVERTVVRRFASASRLVLTVVTIGLAQLLTACSGIVVQVLVKLSGGGGGRAQQVIRATRGRQGPPEFRTPLSGHRFEITKVVMTGDHLLALAVTAVALGALAAFFRWSTMGIAVRGVAENRDRASLLGIEVERVSSVVWVITALLAGVGALLLLGVEGQVGAQGGAFGVALLLPALAAGVLARMESLPLTVASALAIAVFQRSVIWSFSDSSVIDAVLLGVILIALFLQRGSLARTQESGGGSWAVTDEVRPVPAALAALRSVRRTKRNLTLGATALVVAFPWVASPGQTVVGTSFAIFAMVCVSLVILSGWGGQISLGQFAFVAVGAAIGGSLIGRHHLPLPLAVVAAGAAGAGAAVLLGLPALRIKGIFLAVTTLAFAIAVPTVLLNRRYFGWFLPDRVDRPVLLGLDLENDRAWFYVCVSALAITVVLVQGIRASRTGRVLIAMRDNERAAQAFGVNLVRTRLATFALSGAVASIAGVLLAVQERGVNAPTFGPDQSVQVFLMAIIGGLGSVAGVLLGAVYLAVTRIWLADNIVGQLLSSSVGVLAVLFLFPGGLGGVAFSARDAYLRRTARRHRVRIPGLVGRGYLAPGDSEKIPIAPKTGSDSDVPVRYSKPSRIGIAGSSQGVGA